MSMRITFHQEGGIAAFPGLSKPVTVEAEALPPAEAAELKRLLSRKLESAAAAGGDRRTYCIEVDERGGRCQSFRLTDPVPAELRSLVHWLQAAGRRSIKARQGP